MLKKSKCSVSLAFFVFAVFSVYLLTGCADLSQALAESRERMKAQELADSNAEAQAAGKAEKSKKNKKSKKAGKAKKAKKEVQKFAYETEFPDHVKIYKDFVSGMSQDYCVKELKLGDPSESTMVMCEINGERVMMTKTEYLLSCKEIETEKITFYFTGHVGKPRILYSCLIKLDDSISFDDLKAKYAAEFPGVEPKVESKTSVQDIECDLGKCKGAKITKKIAIFESAGRRVEIVDEDCEGNVDNCEMSENQKYVMRRMGGDPNSYRAKWDVYYKTVDTHKLRYVTISDSKMIDFKAKCDQEEKQFEAEQKAKAEKEAAEKEAAEKAKKLDF